MPTGLNRRVSSPKHMPAPCRPHRTCSAERRIAAIDFALRILIILLLLLLLLLHASLKKQAIFLIENPIKVKNILLKAFFGVRGSGFGRSHSAATLRDCSVKQPQVRPVSRSRPLGYGPPGVRGAALSAVSGVLFIAVDRRVQPTRASAPGRVVSSSAIGQLM